MAHGVTPEALARGARARRPGARAAFIVSPTYYGMAADVAGCAEVAHAAGVPLVVDQSWGPHFGFHPDAAAERAARSAPTRCSPRRTRSSARSRSRRCCTSPAPAGSTPTRSRARVRLVRSTSPSSLLMASLDGARRQLVAARRGAAVAARSPPRAAPREAIDADPRLPRRRRRADRPARASPGWDPLRIVIDVRAHRRDRLRGGRRAALRTTTSRSSSPRRRRSCSCSASTSRRASSSASSTTSPRSCGGWSGRARPRRVTLRRRRVRERGRRARRARRSSARRDASPSTTPIGRVSRRGDRRLPAGHPGAAAGRADHRRGDRLPARAGGRRRAPARRERPGLPHHRRALRRALTDDELIDRALAEDVGDGDATTAATVDAGARGAARRSPRRRRA